MRIDVMGRCQKVQNLTFKVSYLCQKSSESVSIIYFIETIYRHIFCYWHFLMISIFKSFHFLKWCPLFDNSPLHQFETFKIFLWMCWFLGKNLSNFVPTVWKLNNPYCHSLYQYQISQFSSLDMHYNGLFSTQWIEFVHNCYALIKMAIKLDLN